MELGDSNTAERNERSRLDVVLDKLNVDLAELLEAVESGGLDQLTAAQKISFWQKFETLRNRLPLIDPDGPAPVDEQLQQDRRHLEVRQRRDGMWQLEG
jgi:hypothetical protein